MAPEASASRDASRGSTVCARPCVRRRQRARIDALKFPQLGQRQHRLLVELHVTVFRRCVDFPRELLEMPLHLVGPDEDLEVWMRRDARRRPRMGDGHDREDLEVVLLVEKDVGEITGQETIALEQEIVGDTIALLSSLKDGAMELAAVGELPVRIEVRAADVPVLRLDVENAILLEHEEVDLKIAALELHEHIEGIGELGEPLENGAVDRLAL